MVPVWMLPLIIQIATRTIKYAFDKLDELPEEKKSLCLDKIDENDKKDKLK